MHLHVQFGNTHVLRYFTPFGSSLNILCLLGIDIGLQPACATIQLVQSWSKANKVSWMHSSNRRAQPKAAMLLH